MMFNNLLNSAFTIIPTQVVQVKRFIDNVVDDAGYLIPDYEEDLIDIKASIQSVPADEMKALGLDFTKRTMKLFTSFDVKSLNTLKQSDIIIYEGIEYDVSTPEDWRRQDGWQSYLLVERKQ